MFFKTLVEGRTLVELPLEVNRYQILIFHSEANKIKETADSINSLMVDFD